MKDKEKIEHILEFTCSCGYNFKNYQDDIFKLSYNEVMWMKKDNFIICIDCKKKYTINLLKQYMRKNKIKKLCQNIIT